MKLLHVSDLHIGKRMNGVSMIEDQRFILSSIAKIARDKEVDALLIAGDIYDKASPSAEAVTVFDAFLMALSQAGIRVIAIPGNHDSAERIAYAHGLLAAQGVCFAPVYDGEVHNVKLEDEHGVVTFWLLPFLKPADVRRFFPDADIGDDYTLALECVLGDCAIDASTRNVILSHQLVTNAQIQPDRADEEITLGGIDNVDVTLFDAFDYAALGHVHRPQRIGRDTVRYSGSPLKYSFSEACYEKSCVLVELGPKAESDQTGSCVDFELVALSPLHDMREVRATLAELLESANQNEAGSEDYLHVTLTDEHPQLDAMAKIREAYPNALYLDYDNASLLLLAQDSRSTVDPDKEDTVELFEKFYEEQVGKPLDDIQRGYVEDTVREVEQECARGTDGDGGGAR